MLLSCAATLTLERPVGLVTGRGGELLVWSAAPDAEQQPVSDGRGGGGVPAHLCSLPGAALAAVTAAATAATDDPCAVQRACEAAASAAEAVPWVDDTPQAAVYDPVTRHVVWVKKGGQSSEGLWLLGENGESSGFFCWGGAPSGSLALDGQGGVFYTTWDNIYLTPINSRISSTCEEYMDTMPECTAAIAYDTDRGVLYSATTTEVYRGSGQSVRRFDAPARWTSLLGAEGGGGAGTVAVVQQAAVSPGQGPFMDIRCLLPLPGSAGLLVGDGPHLRRIDPDGAVRTLLPQALRSAAAADGSGCGSGGSDGDGVAQCPLTSLAFVPGGGAGGGTVVAASAGCPRLLLCSAEELSRSYSCLEAVAERHRQTAFSRRLMSALRLQPSNDDIRAAAGPAGAVTAAAQNAAAVVTIRVCPASGSNGRRDNIATLSGGGNGSGGGSSGGGAPSAAACFVAHRAVLSAHSDFFKQLLALEPPSGGGGGGGGASFAEGGAAQVELRETDPDVFARLLAYMYTGALGEDLDLLQPAQQKAVAELAGRLLLPGAITLLQPRLLAAAVAAPETAVGELVWAASHSLTGLVEELSGFVVAHAASVLPATPQEALAALAAAQPKLMAAMVQAIAVAAPPRA